MALPDGERLASLEAKMTAVERSIEKIETSLANLDKIAQRGGGALNATLLLGGLMGWAIGVGATIYEAVHVHH